MPDAKSFREKERAFNTAEKELASERARNGDSPPITDGGADRRYCSRRECGRASTAQSGLETRCRIALRRLGHQQSVRDWPGIRGGWIFVAADHSCRLRAHGFGRH